MVNLKKKKKTHYEILRENGYMTLEEFDAFFEEKIIESNKALEKELKELIKKREEHNKLQIKIQKELAYV